MIEEKSVKDNALEVESAETKNCGTKEIIILINVEGFATQPATLVNWPPLHIVPRMTLIHKSKYIFGILHLFLTRFPHFSNFQEL
jgi:hypothetical protein